MKMEFRTRDSGGLNTPDTILPQNEVVEDDDPPMLSSYALEALKEFLAEQNSTTVHESSAEVQDEEVALMTEDWGLSQFWYDRDTAETVAKEVLTLCHSLDSPSVACIACPTLYAYLKVRGTMFRMLFELLGTVHIWMFSASHLLYQ